MLVRSYIHIGNYCEANKMLDTTICEIKKHLHVYEDDLSRCPPELCVLLSKCYKIGGEIEIKRRGGKIPPGLLTLLTDVENDNRLLLANTYLTLGSVFEEMGSYDLGLRFNHKALHAYQQAYGENTEHVDIAKCLYKVVRCQLMLNSNNCYKCQCCAFFLARCDCGNLICKEAVDNIQRSLKIYESVYGKACKNHDYAMAKKTASMIWGKQPLYVLFLIFGLLLWFLILCADFIDYLNFLYCDEGVADNNTLMFQFMIYRVIFVYLTVSLCAMAISFTRVLYTTTGIAQTFMYIEKFVHHFLVVFVLSGFAICVMIIFSPVTYAFVLT